MNEATKKVIVWVKGDSSLAKFLADIAEGENEFEYGDDKLAEYVSQLLNSRRGNVEWDMLTHHGVDVSDTEKLTGELESMTADRSGWIDLIDWEQVRIALLANATYVHSLVKGFHPNNRYRVLDEERVNDLADLSADGIWVLGEDERQVCPDPIGEPCSARSSSERGTDHGDCNDGTTCRGPQRAQPLVHHGSLPAQLPGSHQRGRQDPDAWDDRRKLT